MKTLHIAAALCLAAITTTGLRAQTPAAQPSASTSSPAPMADGEVRKVDREQSKLTLRHGPIQTLGMPAMTMVFKVADPNMLVGMKDGDKVRFRADRDNGQFTITAIEPTMQAS